jgi:hypothetical protein
VLATALVTLAALAGRRVALAEEERRSAGRRALLLLAAGGDPSRGLDLNGPAVERLAGELDAPDRRDALIAGLTEIRKDATGLPHVTEAVYGLLDAPDVAWRAYACSLLADELTD